MSKKSEYRLRILNFIHKEKVVTTTEVSNRFQISWNTAERYLLELALENKATRMKKKGVNLWVYYEK